MRRIALVILSVLLLSPVRLCAYGGGTYCYVPEVAYEKPAYGSTVDITGNDTLRFQWQRVPIPSSGRDSFRFTLYKGSGYDVIVSETIEARTFHIDVNADKFENGGLYRWHVKQRDARTMIWSRYEDWYFKVVKR